MKKEPEKFTREWFVMKGKKGGQRTKELHGLKRFQQLNEIRWKNKKVDNSEKTAKTIVK